MGEAEGEIVGVRDGDREIEAVIEIVGVGVIELVGVNNGFKKHVPVIESHEYPFIVHVQEVAPIVDEELPVGQMTHASAACNQK